MRILSRLPWVLPLFGTSALVLLACIVWVIVTEPLPPGRGDAMRTIANPQRLKAHVEMVSEAFGPRGWKDIENLDRVAAYIGRELVSSGAKVEEQPFRMHANNENRGKTYRNVVATLGPETRERIVVGAHYDAYLGYPAADDNASGVAALMEVARMLAGEPPSLRVELVAFSLEEPFVEGAKGNFRTPDGGSAVHANALRARGAQVRLMFSLETIGFFSDQKNSQDFPISLLRLFYPTAGNYIMVVSNLENSLQARRVKTAMRAASALPVYSISAPSSVEGIDYSDHFNYWRNGYPAVMITDTAFDRNKAYHTAGDTADRLDYRRMAMVAQGVFSAVSAAAK